MSDLPPLQRVLIPSDDEPSKLSVLGIFLVALAVGLAVVNWSMDKRPAAASAPSQPSDVPVAHDEDPSEGPKDPAKDRLATAPLPDRKTTAPKPKVEPTKVEPTKVEPTKVEPTKVEPAKVEPAKVEPAKVEPAKVEPTETPKTDDPAVDESDDSDESPSSIKRLKRGRLAYIQCTGAERAAGYPCPRDKPLEAKTWRILNSLVGCSIGPRVPGNADVRLVFRGTDTAPEIKFREMPDGLPYGKIKACIADKVSGLRTTVASERLVISFRFSLL